METLHSMVALDDEDSLRGLLYSCSLEDINAYNDKFYTPLHLAVMCSRADIVRLLLENGADANKATPYNVTPIMLACRAGRLDLLELLLAHGADVSRKADNGADWLTFAHEAGSEECVLRIERWNQLHLPGD